MGKLGYHRAGFEVVGVDNKPQPHYPFEFHQADALEFPLEGFDVYHASPPCQRYSTCTPMRYRNNHPDLIAKVRNILEITGKPYVIESVENARSHLVNPIKLCGTSFGMNLRRHRYFEVSPTMFFLQTPCDHSRNIVYVSGSTGSSTAKFHRRDFTVAERREAMGTPWMNDKELDQAIPPAYTEYIGKCLLQALNTY